MSYSKNLLKQRRAEQIKDAIIDTAVGLLTISLILFLAWILLIIGA